MGTKANPGKYDSYDNAEPDEPVFVLLARDRHAPALVWLWAVLRELDNEDEAVVAEARACVVQMIGWAHDRGRKTVGLGETALVGVFELIRAANAALAEGDNTPSDVETVR